MDIYEESLELHEKYGGKLETKSKISLISKEILARAYSPGVGAISNKIAQDKKNSYIYTLKKDTIAIVSDGSAILGLGNLGAYAAIPVMEGKACIFKEFANVNAFPICLNTQDTEEIISIIKNIEPVFGGINLEDISAPRCFEIEERLRKELSIPVMHDDQWGAATITLVGLINAIKLRGLSVQETKIVISGIGAAGVATARLLFAYGFSKIIFVDSKGIITKKRTDLTKEKKELLEYSSTEEKDGGVADALIGSDVFIGLSKGNTISPDMVRSMNERPILFTLANPIPEIMPEDARKAGAYIIATGRGDYPNQINNSLIFPGIFKGILQIPGAQFEIGLFVFVAQKIVEYYNNPTEDELIPSMFDFNIVSVVEEAVILYYAK